MKTAKEFRDNQVSPLTDCGIARCPDVLAFHRSLDRRFDKNHNYLGERHPFYELVYVAEGTVGITAEEEVYTLSAGQMLLHQPNEFHRIWSEFGSCPHVLNLSFFAAAVPSFSSRILQLSELDQAELFDISACATRGLNNNDRALLNETRIRLELWLLRMTKSESNVTTEHLILPSAIRYAEIVTVLMTPSELATMPGDRCILQLRGLPPFYSRKYDLKQHPNFKYTAEADKKNAFNLDRLINRRRRPGPNEACEVYEVDVPAEALTEEDEDILNYDDLDDPDAFV